MRIFKAPGEDIASSQVLQTLLNPAVLRMWLDKRRMERTKEKPAIDMSEIN